MLSTGESGIFVLVLRARMGAAARKQQRSDGVTVQSVERFMSMITG